MQSIIPMRDLSTKTSQIVEKCSQTNEPIFVTKNGYGALVVMSMEAYNRKMAQLDLYEQLAAAERDLEAGRVVSMEEVHKGIRAIIENA